jgi:hypothetical protein
MAKGLDTTGFTPRTWKVLKVACRLRKKGYLVPGGEAKAADTLVELGLVTTVPGPKGSIIKATEDGVKAGEAHEKATSGGKLPDPDE